MNVIITDQAFVGLKAIGDFIRPNNPTRAISFVEELIDRCYELGDMPTAYPLVPRYEKYGVRRRLCGDYLVFYIIREDVVSVVHVCHGSQDYETLLFPRG